MHTNYRFFFLVFFFYFKIFVSRVFYYIFLNTLFEKSEMTHSGLLKAFPFTDFI